jgi:hypothetical protein
MTKLDIGFDIERMYSNDDISKQNDEALVNKGCPGGDD